MFTAGYVQYLLQLVSVCLCNEKVRRALYVMIKAICDGGAAGHVTLSDAVLQCAAVQLQSFVYL